MDEKRFAETIPFRRTTLLPSLIFSYLSGHLVTLDRPQIEPGGCGSVLARSRRVYRLERVSHLQAVWVSRSDSSWRYAVSATQFTV